MGNSLQEQLLKAGLVNKTKAQQAKKQNRKKKRNPATKGQRDSVAQAVAKTQSDKAARDRELNRRKEIKMAAKARKGLLREFIEKNMLNDRKAEEVYNFTHGSSVKRIHVNPKQREQLGMGQLAVVHASERYYLVSLETSKKVQEMDSNAFIFVAHDEKTDVDDPYADYQVPDDLMW